MSEIDEAVMQSLQQQLQAPHDAEKLQQFVQQLTAQHGPKMEYLCGEWLLSTGKPELALPYLAQAVQAFGQDALVAHNHGEALRQLGQSEAAAREFQRAIGLQPHFLPARRALIDLLEKVLLRIRAAGNAGLAELQAQGLSSLLNDTGNILLDQGQGFSAMDLYRRAVFHMPYSAAALSNLGNVLHMDGQLEQAEHCCRQALEINPKLASAWNNLGNVLAERELEQEAAACYDRAIALDSNLKDQAEQNKWGGTLFNLLHSDRHSDAEVFQRHRSWGLRYPLAHRGGTQTPALDWQPGAVMTVGYLSADFRSHAMRHYLEPLLAGHDPAKVKVVCYAQSPVVDEYTQQLMGYGHLWRPIHGLDDSQLCALIRSDGVHVLVDCLGHTQGSRVTALAHKPAPVLMSYLGYLGTTGLPAMDFRITDAWIDPPGMTEHYHTEQLLRVPGGSLGYMPHWQSPEVNRLPALEKGYITFGSLNKLKKLNVAVVKLWARILHAVPGSRLLLKTKQLADPRSAGRVLGLFESQGIEAARIELQPATSQHLQAYHHIDIALDPFPFGGGATSCDALWMGVPVVTLPGSRSASRLTHCILHSLGCEQWSTVDEDAYVACAVELASHAEHLDEIRQQLRRHMQASPMMRPQAIASRFESLYAQALSRREGLLA
ncbi:tetratricopeptide repeat protein [Comamonas sp. GB3 AK4-5]|uniref:O-linked N-acetylglucosamine transferase, SPINDLY family protein n=1 Tax=Comamonas sp. GB3 AK4-5 TaxID=3231487 RepID=UPI00351DAF5C